MTVPAKTLPAVTVIVPVFNDFDRLALCLRLIADQDYGGRVQIIVVDNASSIDLAGALPAGDSRFRLIREARRGSYAARNAGLGAAHEADIYAFTDADCRPHRDWLRSAVSLLTAEGAPDAVGGAIRLVFRDGGDPRTGPELYESFHDFNQQFYVERAGFAATANLIVRREVMDRVGPFDASLQSGGDDDWGHRLRADGGRLVFSAQTIVDHPARSSWRELTVKTRRVALGMAALTAGQPWREDARFLRDEATESLRTWVGVWRRSWPTTAGAKLRYSLALGWVATLHCSIRVASRILHPARGRKASQPNTTSL